MIKLDFKHQYTLIIDFLLSFKDFYIILDRNLDHCLFNFLNKGIIYIFNIKV